MFFILLVIQQLNSQNSASYYFFNNEYEKADSLYTLIIKNFPSGYHYFERANCRGKMANKQGYCEDLAYACYYEYNEAYKPFLKTCGKIDTTIKLVEPQPKDYKLEEYKIKYKLKDTSILLVKFRNVYSQLYSQKAIDSIKLVDSISFNPNDTSSVNAEFVGGISKMIEFISRNIKAPKNKFAYGKVYLRFIVIEDGSIQNITVMKGITECRECDDEAQKVLVRMPKWKPARLKGKRVKSYFNIPISFK